MFRSLALKLTVFNVFIIVLLLALSAAATYFLVRHTLRSDLAGDIALTIRDFQGTEPFRRAYGERAVIPGFEPINAAGRSGSEEEREDEDRRANSGRIDYPVWLVDRQGRLLDFVTPHQQDDLPGSVIPYPQGITEALSGRKDERSLEVEGESFRVLSLPVTRSNQSAGVVQVAAPEASIQQLLSTLLASLLGVGIIGVAIAVLGGYVLTTRALAPIRAAFQRQRNFIADASHELRTPVAVIRADAEVLDRSLRNLDPEDAQILQDLIHESAFLGHVIGQLVAAARVQDVETRPPVEPVDLAALVRETAHAIEPLATGKGISVRVDVPAEKLMTLGSPIQLRLALMGLLDNAVKYNRPGGSVTVQAGAEDSWLVVAITDTGEGISEEDQKHVFERFYRVQRPLLNNVEGTGLGLTIAQDVARQYGGDVTLRSRWGEGTTVALRLRRR